LVQGLGDRPDFFGEKAITKMANQGFMQPVGSSTPYRKSVRKSTRTVFVELWETLHVSIGTLFGELSTIAMLNDTKTRIDATLAERSALAGSLNGDLLVSQDVVTFSGRVETRQVASWERYYPEDGRLREQLNALFQLKDKLEAMLDRFRRMRQQDQVATENAIAQGNVFS
jgi:hypothetical protein